MQGSSQAVLQQTPATQKPLAHSALREHTTPDRTWQRPLLSQYEPGQSVSLRQWSRQVAVTGSQRYGTQMIAGAGRQPPWPLQAIPPTTASPSQCPAPQGVPAGRGTQIPAAPGSAQVLQPSAQATLQQTPSMQKPLAQSAADAHGCPS